MDELWSNKAQNSTLRSETRVKKKYYEGGEKKSPEGHKFFPSRTRDKVWGNTQPRQNSKNE